MRKFIFIATLIMLFGCASVSYLGESYPPTEHVDIYFSEEDIEREYKIIGQIIATARSDEILYSSEKFMKEIRKKAREKGADGVVILGFGQVVTGMRGTEHGTEKTEKKGTKTTHKIERVSVEEKRRIEALAIKYKSE